MTTSPKSNDRQTNSPDFSAITMLFTTIADTTWRMFVPTIGGTIIGIWLDRSFGTVPLFTISLITLGTLTSILLVIVQLRGLRKK